MLNVEKWFELSELGYRTLAIDYIESDGIDLIANLRKESALKGLTIPLYYWNSGSNCFNVVEEKASGNLSIAPSSLAVKEDNLLEKIASHKGGGIFLIEDWLSSELLPNVKKQRESQLQNFVRDNVGVEPDKLVFFLKSDYQLSSKISALVPVLKQSLPTASEVRSLLSERLANYSSIESQIESKIESKIESMVIALLGLSRAEIRYAIELYNCSKQKFEDLIYEYKISRFRGLGLEFIATPDVEKAGGLDLLQEYFKTIAQLNSPTAAKYNLVPPKGMLLLGVPGTGKTLCAKLAAKMLGYSLMGFSWSNILGADNSDRALSQILEIADTIDRVVLLADDFDKGFTGWNEGGTSMRLSQKLLTWMEEHTSRVLMIATVNRIGLLPAELKRRFDDGGIWFVDLPSIGEMQDIFTIYLRSYFPEQFQNKNPWSEREWYKLLKQYRGATPIEIKNAIIRCATTKYCNLSPNEKDSGKAIFVTVEDLLAQLDQFVKSIDRDGEDLRAIRNSAHNFKRASSPDRSIFVRQKQSMFNYQPHELEKV